MSTTSSGLRTLRSRIHPTYFYLSPRKRQWGRIYVYVRYEALLNANIYLSLTPAVITVTDTDTQEVYHNTPGYIYVNIPDFSFEKNYYVEVTWNDIPAVDKANNYVYLSYNRMYYRTHIVEDIKYDRQQQFNASTPYINMYFTGKIDFVSNNYTYLKITYRYWNLGTSTYIESGSIQSLILSDGYGIEIYDADGSLHEKTVNLPGYSRSYYNTYKPGETYIIKTNPDELWLCTTYTDKNYEFMTKETYIEFTVQSTATPTESFTAEYQLELDNNMYIDEGSVIDFPIYTTPVQHYTAIGGDESVTHPSISYGEVIASSKLKLLEVNIKNHFIGYLYTITTILKDGPLQNDLLDASNPISGFVYDVSTYVETTGIFLDYNIDYIISPDYINAARTIEYNSQDNYFLSNYKIDTDIYTESRNVGIVRSSFSGGVIHGKDRTDMNVAAASYYGRIQHNDFNNTSHEQIVSDSFFVGSETTLENNIERLKNNFNNTANTVKDIPIEYYSEKTIESRLLTTDKYTIDIYLIYHENTDNSEKTSYITTRHIKSDGRTTETQSTAYLTKHNDIYCVPVIYKQKIDEQL